MYMHYIELIFIHISKFQYISQFLKFCDASILPPKARHTLSVCPCFIFSLLCLTAKLQFRFDLIKSCVQKNYDTFFAIRRAFSVASSDAFSHMKQTIPTLSVVILGFESFHFLLVFPSI